MRRCQPIGKLLQVGRTCQIQLKSPDLGNLRESLGHAVPRPIRKNQFLAICSGLITESDAKLNLITSETARNGINRAKVQRNYVGRAPVRSSVRLSSIHAFKNAPEKFTNRHSAGACFRQNRRIMTRHAAGARVQF